LAWSIPGLARSAGVGGADGLNRFQGLGAGAQVSWSASMRWRAPAGSWGWNRGNRGWWGLSFGRNPRPFPFRPEDGAVGAQQDLKPLLGSLGPDNIAGLAFLEDLGDALHRQIAHDPREGLLNGGFEGVEGGLQLSGPDHPVFIDGHFQAASVGKPGVDAVEAAVVGVGDMGTLQWEIAQLALEGLGDGDGQGLRIDPPLAGFAGGFLFRCAGISEEPVFRSGGFGSKR